ncbi:fumarate hydratase [Mailhella massiliensis]|uniref:Fumarate hydratase n=1 Tax=Mailhella massiliensis TaxID=1903261 RepID=A0A921DSM9_9BACT|nr:fumarate hydratase [Mailhella massiliensis]HJD98313.1 fumarate hydratase [Mailhella massiliensis]
MREISADLIRDTVARLAVEACCNLPKSTLAAMRRAREEELSPTGRDVLDQLIENAGIAETEHVPLCQDTGLAVVFAEIGQEVHITGGLFEDAVNQGVAKGYTEGYLRKSSVEEPLFERRNTGDNTPAVIHTRLVGGDRITLRLAPKGAGSENKGALYMLVPADGIEGVKKAVLETVRHAGASPCPPMVIGVGIGGNMELACLCAKKACARDVESRNPDPRYARLEEELLDMVNKLGTGPAGLGGSVTAFKVNVEFCATHIACLPVAVNINCNAARHAEAVL